MARTKDVVLAPEQKELMEKEYLDFVNPTCSLYAYNSLILKYRFFEFRKMYHTNFSSSL